MTVRPSLLDPAAVPSPSVALIEICTEDLAGVAAAHAAGAGRIELCANLAQGGVTPSIGTVAQALKTPIDLRALIRQRPGDFCFSAAELEAMVNDIHAIRALRHAPGVTVGFAVGALTTEGLVDSAALDVFMEAAADRPVTFHKAFDEINDRYAALETLISAGVRTVLTSGGAATAAAGAEELSELVGRATGRATILAGGGVRPGNASALIARTGVTEIHLRAPDPTVSDRQVTSAEIVSAIVAEVAAGMPT